MYLGFDWILLVTATLTEYSFRRSGIEKPTSEDYKERERELNKNLDEIEGIIEKVLKQTKDLLGQTWNDSSVEELSDRISHIKVSASLFAVNR